MIAGVKAELKKIFTIRSTYIWLGITLAYLGLYNFYITGWKGGAVGDQISLHNPLYLVLEVSRARGIAPLILFSSIIAVLLMAHEYRYNTIMHTLTLSNSRNKTLLSKIIAITGFSIVFSLLIEILAPSLTLLGLHLHHLTLAHQTFYFQAFFVRVLFYGWAYAMIGVLLAVLFRNIVASLALLFLLPAVIEPLVGLLLNAHQQQYLPFTALTSVLNNGIFRPTDFGLLSAQRSALIVLLYLVIGWAVGWIIFLRRDAN